ncbi:MAG: sporulation initiation factor Spo0A C-terminal domain-containing protein [Oscillibacter sp.]|jgi:hypothetical protein|nr:sporulation initiation factor Spo0A C-terminal domain-containing protein [Oscillibacter sp.]
MTADQLARELGIPGNYTGYRQLILAMELATEDENRILNIYRDIYGEIAQQNHTTARSVEKNIRTVLRAAWQRGPHTRRSYERIGGYSCMEKPVTSEFLDITSEYLRKNQSIGEESLAQNK